MAVSRFKPPREARTIARDFVDRMNKTGLTGFAAPVAAAESVPPPSRQSQEPPPPTRDETLVGVPTGASTEGRQHLDPTRRRAPGAETGDWQRLP